MNDLKRFDDYTCTVDCNECAHYWDSSCDGASKGSTAVCNSFLATRKVVIPEKINQLEERVKTLSRIVACLVGWEIGGLIAGLIGVLFFG